jgi:hypothetical protein
MPGGDKSEPWSRRVVEILPNGQVQLAGGDDYLILKDGSLNPIDPKGAVFADSVQVFDERRRNMGLFGARWHGHERTSRPLQGRGLGTGHRPRRSFECFRVEGEWQTTGRYVNVRGRDIYWYCPRLNFIAKRQTEFTREIRGQPTVSEARLSELTKFTPAP